MNARSFKSAHPFNADDLTDLKHEIDSRPEQFGRLQYGRLFAKQLSLGRTRMNLRGDEMSRTVSRYHCDIPDFKSKRNNPSLKPNDVRNTHLYLREGGFVAVMSVYL